MGQQASIPSGCLYVTLKKVALKEGEKSGIKVGKIRKLIIEPPAKGLPLKAYKLREHGISRETKIVGFNATTEIEEVTELSDISIKFTTETSLYEGIIHRPSSPW